MDTEWLNDFALSIINILQSMDIFGKITYICIFFMDEIMEAASGTEQGLLPKRRYLLAV